ncbi:MAG: SDR family NAD(P)-dependent oxidoreductase [Rhizobacter sp.]|nr:SDR family NAD(P)-dependent oxidoreductase [Chlorobiales bacterium]
MPKVWFITGVSTGFGRALAEALIERGETVVATARDTAKLSELAEKAPAQVLALPLDVTKPEMIRTALDAAIARFRRIDVLVNNAGYGLLGAVEELSDEELRSQFETNFFGLVKMTQAVLPLMRAAKSGHILNLSSIAGFRGVMGGGAYNASKFAIEGLSEALAMELAPLGIKVTIVEPGAFRTDFAGRSLNAAARIIDDYAATAGTVRSGISAMDGNQQGDPHLGARAMIEIVGSETPPLRLVLGADALRGVRKKLDEVAAELDKWESLTVATAFKDGVKAISAS